MKKNIQESIIYRSKQAATCFTFAFFFWCYASVGVGALIWQSESPWFSFTLRHRSQLCLKKKKKDIWGFLEKNKGGVDKYGIIK